MNLEVQWIVGFVEGEGCFHVSIRPNPDKTAGFDVLTEFRVVQHQQNVQVLYALKENFGCGVVRTNDEERMVYKVQKKQHLLEIILPYFMKHLMKTKRNVEFRKFRRILLMIEKDKHLTTEGMEEIRTVAAQMKRRNA